MLKILLKELDVLGRHTNSQKDLASDAEMFKTI
jgi:hypothetical protein